MLDMNSWIIRIFAAVIIFTLLELLIPRSSNVSGMARIVVGLFIILTIIEPMAGLFGLPARMEKSLENLLEGAGMQSSGSYAGYTAGYLGSGRYTGYRQRAVRSKGSEKSFEEIRKEGNIIMILGIERIIGERKEEIKRHVNNGFKDMGYDDFRLRDLRIGIGGYDPQRGGSTYEDSGFHVTVKASVERASGSRGGFGNDDEGNLYGGKGRVNIGTIEEIRVDDIKAGGNGGNERAIPSGSRAEGGNKAGDREAQRAIEKEGLSSIISERISEKLGISEDRVRLDLVID